MKIWLTGATGYLGQVVAAELTREGHEVVATVRRAEDRRDDLARDVVSWGGDARRLDVHEGDLDAHDFGLDDAGRAAIDDADAVVHLAARFAFGLAWEDALRTNVEASTTLLRFAAALPKRPRFVHAGGYRAFGSEWRDLSSEGEPSSIALRRFAVTHGAYETSKLLSVSRVAVLGEALGHDVRFVHPSSVLGRHADGRTTQSLGLGDAIADLWHGRMPALAGAKDTFVPIVSVDVVARMFRAAVERDTLPSRDLVVLDENTPSFLELLRAATTHLGVPLPKLVVSPALARRLPRALSGVEPEALSFLSNDRYDVSATRQVMEEEGVVMPPWREVLERWLDHLVATDFLAREGRVVDAAGVRTVVEGPSTASVIALHGLPLTRAAWDPLRAALSATNDPSLLAVDLPGLGLSGDGARDARWLHALARPDRPIVVAHSLGSVPAIEAALEGQVEALVLVSPFFLQTRASTWLRMPWLTSQVFSRATPARLREAVVGSDALEDEGPIVHAAAHLRRPGVACRHAKALAEASDLALREALAAKLAKVKVPVVLLHGDRDPLIVTPPSNARVVTVEGAGHSPMLTHPHAIARVVREVMRRERGVVAQA
ncbi:MAG: alpha/beta fold hydrolase [Sandaracinus sp.]|nr:alpha/beta fold hydrolase [Sandaracinus sp.]MCB9613573.1 alpha/beta fold hydrolase [Sandaracinus sp.]